MWAGGAAVSHPIETLLLPRLEGLRKAPARAGETIQAWRSHCPACNSHGHPLSIAISARPGAAGLINCKGGCAGSPLPALEALGLCLSDLYPMNDRHVAKGNGGPHAWSSVYSAGEATLRALEMAFSLLARAADKPEGEQEFEEYLKAVFEAAAELQNFKKFMRAAVRGGNAK